MTLLQALLIALLGYLGSIYGTFLLGTVGGWNMIGRPIVAGALIGLILGDVKNGVLIGAAIQALYVGLVTPGMSVPGDVNFASYIGIPLALVSNASPEYAVGISVPLSLLGVAAVYSVATFNAVFVHLQDALEYGGRLSMKQGNKNSDLFQYFTICRPLYSNFPCLLFRGRLCSKNDCVDP